jgi:hypothetical protein
MQGETYSGSGSNVWNWQALGVSRSLWNMVRGCLKVGLGKDAIFQIIQAIQGGVVDNDKFEEEEADEPEEEEEDDVRARTAMPQDDSDARMRMIVNTAVADKSDVSSISRVVIYLPDSFQNTGETFTNTWKASTPVPNPILPTAGPSNPAPVTTTVAIPPPTAAQSFGLPQPTPYPNLSYGYYTYFQQPPPNQTPGPPQHPAGTADPNHNTINKRPFTFATDGAGTSDTTSMEPSQKRTRHCCKCGSQDCKGKGGRSFCMNVCQDCGKLDCKGRNSRRPDKRCVEAWT